MYLVSLFVNFFFLSGSVVAIGPRLSLLPSNDCGSCVGHQQVYECTTVGIGSTVWRGTAFTGCPGNSIILSHSLFSSGTSGTCNSGAIMGRSLRRDNNQGYTSQLNVTVDASMNSQTISCIYNNGASESEIGTNTILIIEDPFPAPHDIRLASIDPSAVVDSPGHNITVTFSWTLVQENCPAIHYDITAINCGTCPDTVINSQATCNNVVAGPEIVCSFAVNTVACSNIVASPSNPASITVALKVPNPPSVNSVPLYTQRGYLKIITTTFEESQSFMISDEIDGSATSYTISYTDSLSGRLCISSLISHCENRMCSHQYQVSDSTCPNCVDINITVFATNILGNGRSSDVITIESVNRFITVEFDAMRSSVQCTFRRSMATSEKSCNIVYGPGEHCTNLSQSRENMTNALDTVTVKDLIIVGTQYENSEFCSIITASDGSLVARVEHIFNTGCNPQELSDGTPLSDDVRCGHPLHSLAVKNGIVCFSGINVGATAVYFCSSCELGTIRRPSVRTCLQNGSWNGQIPQCECAYQEAKSVEITTILAVSVGLFVLIIIISALAIVVIVSLAIARSKVKTELRRLQAKANVLYDEIGLPSPIIDSTSNIAYASVTKN